MYDNCPFKNGNGYGDGRALSVGEVVIRGGMEAFTEELRIREDKL